MLHLIREDEIEKEGQRRKSMMVVVFGHEHHYLDEIFCRLDHDDKYVHLEFEYGLPGFFRNVLLASLCLIVQQFLPAQNFCLTIALTQRLETCCKMKLLYMRVRNPSRGQQYCRCTVPVC
jgi:hypothetical protein